MDPDLRRWTFACTPLPPHLLQVQLHCTGGHAALAFVEVGVVFADRAAAVLAVGLLRIYGFYISAFV